MTAGHRGAFGRTHLILGWVCAALLPLVIIEMALQLLNMPAGWSRPAALEPPSPGRFDLRMVVICLSPIGWLGGWGYLLTVVWVPLAAYRAWGAIRGGVSFARQERLLLALVPSLVAVIELIHHLTPLRYGYPLP